MKEVNEELLKEVKDFIRVQDDDDMVKILINSAKRLLTRSGVKEDEEDEEYTLAIKLIVSQFYEKRLPSNSNRNNSFVLSLNSLIIQLANK